MIIEKQPLKGIGMSRELVLWMCGAEKHESDFEPEAYTCPDQTTGHLYRGRTHVSLVDLESGRVVNTVPVLSSWSNSGTFDVPYKIARFFYHVDDPLDKNGEGKPRIMWLGPRPSVPDPPGPAGRGDGDEARFALAGSPSA